MFVFSPPQLVYCLVQSSQTPIDWSPAQWFEGLTGKRSSYQTSQLVFTPIALFSGLWCLVMHSFKHQNLNIWGQLILNTGFQQGLFKKICKGKNVYQTKKFLLNEKLWKTFFSRFFSYFFSLRSEVKSVNNMWCPKLFQLCPFLFSFASKNCEFGQNTEYIIIKSKTSLKQPK